MPATRPVAGRPSAVGGGAGVPRPPALDRTPSAHSRYAKQGVWCFERHFKGEAEHPPVRLVIFDWDETLTLSTFVPADRGLRTQIGWNSWAEYITLHNFETPFLVQQSESRVERLHDLFRALRNNCGEGGREDGEPRRTLAILTRNNQGAIACLNLLMMAGLSEHFGAIWCMARISGIPSCVHQQVDGTWATFEAPFGRVYDHKADVLQAIAADPAAWFPQFKDGAGVGSLEALRPEEIVLVDDVRSNFQSPSPAKHRVVRYCKVARYDCHYRELGFKSDMGGIGAKSEADYDVLKDFVKKPWEYKALLKTRCLERPFDGCELMPPVRLVVFGFDETLTLHTWMPENRRMAKEIGCLGTEAQQKYYATYNFASPYLEGDRIKELGSALEELAKMAALAILTRNEDGAVAVLNLLMTAGLHAHFAAIWTWTEGDAPRGVFQQSEGKWGIFDPPLPDEETSGCCKADVLKSIIKSPSCFFPQLDVLDREQIAATAAEEEEGSSSSPIEGLLQEMTMASIVLVDDEPANFRAGSSLEDCVLRFCEVSRYEDDAFRDQGFIPRMGGLGAKSPEDYEVLRNFVEAPWRCREQPIPAKLPQIADDDEELPDLERQHVLDELEQERASSSEERPHRRVSSFS